MICCSWWSGFGRLLQETCHYSQQMEPRSKRFRSSKSSNIAPDSTHANISRRSCAIICIHIGVFRGSPLGRSAFRCWSLRSFIFGSKSPAEERPEMRRRNHLSMVDRDAAPTTATPSYYINARGKLQYSWMRGSVWAHGEVQHAGTNGHKQAVLGVMRKRYEKSHKMCNFKIFATANTS